MNSSFSIKPPIDFDLIKREKHILHKDALSLSINLKGLNHCYYTTVGYTPPAAVETRELDQI